MDAAGNVTELVQRRGDLPLGLHQACLGVGVARGPAGEQSEFQGQRDQALLGAVVQVAFEPLPLLLLGIDDPRAGTLQLVQPGPQLRLQPAVLQGDAGRRRDRVQQLVLVFERPVELEGDDGFVVAIDHPRRPPVGPAGQGDGMPFGVGPAAVLRQPEGKGQRGIVQGSRQRLAQVAGRVRAQVHQQCADIGAGEPGVEQSEQEHDRRQPECGERDVPDRFDLRPAAQTRDEQDREHDQCQTEAVHEQRHRPSTDQARGRSPYEEKGGADEQQGAHRDQLGLLDPAGQDRPGRDGEEAVRIDPEQDLRQLQYRRRSRSRRRRPTGGGVRPPARWDRRGTRAGTSPPAPGRADDRWRAARARSTTAGRSGPSRIRWRSSADRAGSPAGATTRWSR